MLVGVVCDWKRANLAAFCKWGKDGAAASVSEWQVIFDVIRSTVGLGFSGLSVNCPECQIYMLKIIC